MADTGVSGRVAVIVVAVPAIFIEEEFEAAVTVEIVILDQLVLGEAVDHQNNTSFGGTFPPGAPVLCAGADAQSDRKALEVTATKQLQRRSMAPPSEIFSWR